MVLILRRNYSKFLFLWTVEVGTDGLMASVLMCFCRRVDIVGELGRRNSRNKPDMIGVSTAS